ncbi:DNA-processing protein DprA [Patescibacteria group bacterium]|nr:DNA-processing protein DprA [Patescibacteria group bacterium]
MDEETAAWVGFSVFPGIGPVRFRLLREYFGSAEKAWHAPVGTLRDLHLGQSLLDEFEAFRRTFRVTEYLKRLDDLHVRILRLDDPKYPRLLREIPDAPFLLYIKGKRGSSPIDLSRTVAVVGTRNVTRYGTEVTGRFASELAAAGCTVVSGLAYGVDAVAHQAALDAGGSTIAVLGCGIDIIAPPSNAVLYRRIAEEGRGAVVSEMPLGLRPNRGLFPARNRIISGLSLGVLVTEGADDSGALITARNAAEQGREVFAVPGPVTSPYSKGPAKLIKNGAALVESAADILAALGFSPAASQGPDTGRAGDTEEERLIVRLLSHEPLHIDAIVRASGLTAAAVAATLTVLEMKGMVKDLGEKVYRLA